MGLLDIPRYLIHNYLRLVGLLLLIVWGLVQRAWDSVKPALSPVTSIYERIDIEKVSVLTVIHSFVRALLMVGVLYWKMLTTIWEAVSSPFRSQLDSFHKIMAEVQNDHKVAYLHRKEY